MAEKSLDVSEMNNLFGQSLREAVTRTTIFGYVPHPKQVRFHAAKTKGRLYIGGNRSGKTVGGIVEDIWRLRGSHPYQEVHPAPVSGRIVTVSFTEGIKEIIIPNLKRWLPPSDLINGSWEDSYSKADRKLTLSNGSTVELMSYDQDLSKFMGTSRHFIHFDEEPPQDVFNECEVRLLDTGGPWYMTLTPVEGMTWIEEDIYDKGLAGDPRITVITVDTEENPHISKEELDSLFEGKSEREIKIRKQGKFVPLGNRAFPEFTPDHVIDPFIPDPRWTHYMSLDHGLHAPTAWLWHAVSPDGTVYTFDELYDTNKLVRDYAAEIHKRNKLPGRRQPDLAVGDPAIRQRNAQTGDSIQTAYSMLGVPVMLGNNEVRIGVDKMNYYLKAHKWKITSNCLNLIRELQKCKWRVYDTAKKRRDNSPREELHPNYDHAPDSARYLFGLLPHLYLPKRDEGPARQAQLIQSVGEMMHAGLTRVGPERIDTNLQQSMWNPVDPMTKWVDEHMGGEF